MNSQLFNESNSRGIETNGSRNPKRVVLGALAALALVAAPLTGSVAAGDGKHGTKRGPLPADQVVRAADSLYGLKISVKGDVDDVYGPGLFTIEEDSRIQSDPINRVDDLLVILPVAVRSTMGIDDVRKGQDVELVGVLRRGVAPDFEDLKDLDGDVDFDDEPVLVVEEIHFD